MKKHLALLAAVTAVFIFSAALKKSPSPEKYAETITAQDLRTHLSIIASDEYEGRETGEKGQKMAAEYIASMFRSYGIPEQANGTYYQNVNLIKISGGTSTLKATNGNGDTSSFVSMKDYYYAAHTPGITVNSDKIVFVGYGIDDPKYSDYAAFDSTYYKGKTLVMLDGEPVDNKGIFWLTGTNKAGIWTKQRRAKMNAAKKYQAAAILVIPADFEKSLETAKHSIEGYSLIPDEPNLDSEDSPMPVLYINDVIGDFLFEQSGSKHTPRTLQSQINAGGKPLSENVPARIALNITRTEEKIVTENVLGYVEGTDLKNELIVVTAHYDHLGKHDGVVYNGADDDGSGTVAVMEMAQAFMKARQDGSGPRRSMLFMTVSGEEKGLLGSAWYTRHPVYPLESTMCNLNIDMIGRGDEDHATDSNFVYVIGSDKISPDVKKTIEAVNKKYTKMKLDYRYDDPKDPNMFYYRSDHYNFARNGIPVAFFFNGVHADYHKETDEVSKINFNLMQKRARLVFYTAWELANRNKPLAKKLTK